MLAPVDCLHNNVISGYAVIDRVWKAPQDRTSRLLMNPLISEGVGHDASYDVIDGSDEGETQTGLPSLVPLAYFLQLTFGLGPENNTAPHRSPEEPAAYIGPRYGGSRVRHMFGPTRIEFSPQFVRDLQSLIALRIGKALPQGDGELRAILSRQLEEIG
jgi:hypothetical protein